MNFECIGVIQLSPVGAVSSKDVENTVDKSAGVAVATCRQISRGWNRRPSQGPSIKAPDIVVEVISVRSSKDVDFPVMNSCTMP